MKKLRLLNSFLVGSDLIASTLERAGIQLITSGTQALSNSMEHRYVRLTLLFPPVSFSASVWLVQLTFAIGLLLSIFIV